MLHLCPTARDIADPLRIDSGRRDASAMRHRLQQFRSLAGLIGAGPFLRHAPVFKATPLPFRACLFAAPPSPIRACLFTANPSPIRAFQFAATPHRRHYVPFYARPRSAKANRFLSAHLLGTSVPGCAKANQLRSTQNRRVSSRINAWANHIQSPPHNAVTRHRCRRGCPPARPREPPAAST